MTTTETTSTDVERHAAPIVAAETLAYLGLDPRRPETRALVLLCERYRLDPLLGHAAIIVTKNGPRPYITRDGMLEVAHRSGVLDGIVVDELREGEHGWAATVSVHRRDCSHPFTYSAGCGRDEPQAQRGNGTEMALARAERRALCRAFAIPTDDRADDDVQRFDASTTPAPAPAEAIEAVTARVEALAEEQRARFVSWKSDQGFTWPWSVAVVDAMHREARRGRDRRRDRRGRARRRRRVRRW